MLVVEVIVETLELRRVGPPLDSTLWSHLVLYVDAHHLLSRLRAVVEGKLPDLFLAEHLVFPFEDRFVQSHELVVAILLIFPLLHKVTDHLLLDAGQVGLQPRYGFVAA